MLSKQRRIMPALAVALMMLLSMPQIGYAEDAAPADAAVLETPKQEDQPDEAPAPAQEPAVEAEAPREDLAPAPAAEEPAEPVAQEPPAAEPPAEEAPAEAPAAEAPAADAPVDAAKDLAEQAPQAAAAAVDCTPSDRSDAVTGITVNPTVVEVNDVVNVNFSALMTDGGCDGDFIKIPVPPQLAGLNGTFPITAPDGSVIAQMVVTAGMITITFNDYLETHENVRFNGFLKAKVTGVVEPDEQYDLEWNVGDEVFVTPITTVPCENCEPGDLVAGKFAVYEAGPPPFVRFSINTAATRTANETITITDNVGPGHDLDCDSVRMRVGDSVDAWGKVEWDGAWTNYTVQSCDAESVTVRLQATSAGQFFSLDGRSIPTITQESYVDSADVTQAGATTGVRATARLTDGGGDVDGNGREPAVDIEKWSTDEGITEGDHDADPKDLDADQPEQLTFTIVNSGNEILKDIVVADKTTAGTGVVQDLVCEFPDGTTGTTWVGPFAVADTFTCTGTLPALGPDGQHTDLASVTAIGRRTETPVTDEDPWKGVTPPPSTEPPTDPEVDIEKWSTVDGPVDGDHDEDPKTIEVGAEQSITFTVTNTGTEDLKNIRVSDETVAGNGKIKGLTCDFSPLGGPSAGTSWAGPFKVGESFICEGTLTGLKAGQTHRDRATVLATGVDSDTPVQDKDDWNAETQPGLPNTGTPTPESPKPELPATGGSAELVPLGLLGALMIAMGLQLTRRRVGSN